MVGGVGGVMCTDARRSGAKQPKWASGKCAKISLFVCTTHHAALFDFFWVLSATYTIITRSQHMVTAHCHSTLSQHTVTAHCHSTRSQHTVTAHCHSTVQSATYTAPCWTTSVGSTVVSSDEMAQPVPGSATTGSKLTHEASASRVVVLLIHVTVTAAVTAPAYG